MHEGEHNVNKCSFSFSEEYTDDLVKKAIFTSQNSSIEVAIINNECNIPTEILKARNIVLLGVYAYKVVDDKLDLRYSPSPDAFKVNSGSYISETNESEEVTPSQFEQYMQALNDGLNKVEQSIKKMDSATSSVNDLVDEINWKLENGDFIGPEGPQGVPGKNGTDGADGADGVGITTITSGQSSVEEDKTVTPVTVQKSDGSSESFNVEAKNGIDGQNGKDGVNGQDGITPTIGENGNWYLGETDTGKPSRGEVGPSPDLTDYVKNTDYATSVQAGVVRLSNGMTIDQKNGNVFCVTNTKDNYKNAGNGTFISKGTLENIKDDYVGSSQPIQNLNDNLENVVPKETANGEMVSVDDALAYKTFEVKIDGSSEQETTSGKNLLPNNYQSTSLNGITFTVNSDGSITLNGTSTTIVNYKLYGSSSIEGQLPLDAVYISGGTSKVAIQAVHYGGSTYTVLGFNKSGFTEINKEQYTDGYVECRIDSGVELNNEVVYPMLSNEANIDWEPYTGEQPSPNPDYPQEIKTLSFDKITRCGKNLLNASCDEKDEYGITLKADNQYIYINGSNNDANRQFLTNPFLVPAGTYTLSLKKVSGNFNSHNNLDSQSFLFLLYKNTSYEFVGTQIMLSAKDLEQSMTFTLDEPTNLNLGVFARVNEEIFENVKIAYQITKGEEADYTFEPYQGQTYDIDLQGNEMVEIPKGIKDELAVDKQGNVSLVKNIGKVSLDGSIDFSPFIEGTDNGINKYGNVLFVNYNILNEKRAIEPYNAYPTVISNYFKEIEENIWLGEKVAIDVNGSQLIFVVSQNLATTLEEFRTWLQEHNVIVYYQLANPQTIPLGKLTDIITTLNGTNNIFINGNIPTTISTTYALDIKKYIDKKLAEISSAVIEEG